MEDKNRRLLHSMQIYWFNVSNILYQAGCNDELINLAIDIGNNYRNDIDYNNLINIFITNMKHILENNYVYTSIRNITINAIKNNERVPYDFSVLIDVV